MWNLRGGAPGLAVAGGESTVQWSTIDRYYRGSLVLTVISLLVFAGVVYGAWELVTAFGLLGDYILPTPLEVARDLGVEVTSGDLATNTRVTLTEAVCGFGVAAVIAAPIGYAIARLRTLEILVLPFLATSQAIPVVAVAPIVILLLGTGLPPKIAVAAIIAIFPLLTTIVTGLRGVGRPYLDTARVFGASALQTLVQVEIPIAAPTLLNGVKRGLVLSITGAVVGEFLTADSGLGFMINNATGNFEAAPRYVALITLTLLCILLIGIVTLVERTVDRWYGV